jgi:two-component system response regulator GlrR
VGLEVNAVGACDAESLAPRTALAQFIGASALLGQTMSLIARIAQTDATALIYGETGTGKELAARAIHYLGHRKDFPFVAVNCGAIPDSLFENEVFGHQRGAFTDARAPHGGLVGTAERGTLFLDEVEALSPKGQVALLRFLQDHTYRPLGARATLAADVRVVAASNANLGAMVRAGTFRQDLLYRLRIISVKMPPLRARAEDVPLLAEHFLRRFAAQYRCSPKVLDARSLAVFEQHDWPGNVRELETLIHHHFLLTDGDAIRIRECDFEDGHAQAHAEAAAPPAVVAPPPPDLETARLQFRAAKAHAIAVFERAFLIRVLAASLGNVSEAARRCGKERRSFGKLLKKHRISRREFGVAQP